MGSTTKLATRVHNLPSQPKLNRPNKAHKSAFFIYNSNVKGLNFILGIARFYTCPMKQAVGGRDAASCTQTGLSSVSNLI